MRSPSESPTVVTLGLLAVVFACQQVVGLVAPQRAPFALSNPLFAQPWTIVTSVYAHAGVGHLLANAAALALAGLLLERVTTSARFHAFFVSVGALSGVAQVAAVGVLGSLVPGLPGHVSVLGASGAVFGLFGYLLGGNRVTETVVGGFNLSGRTQLAVAAVLAAAVTVATANPGVALIAHFTGLLLGFLAGRTHLLRPEDGATVDDAPAA
ncbi:rhomboid family intramembrane serine protease [Haloarcula litorea]|uniref:rhomboid family intramembrane serine protease n=1 Tax=Haloarcula litorea TaxID=3032579 RepID=UPI0023E8E140|nr:rhomboid family intramembrane serine protease [Halomicroarcula sp. GDY20]